MTARLGQAAHPHHASHEDRHDQSEHDLPAEGRVGSHVGAGEDGDEGREADSGGHDDARAATQRPSVLLDPAAHVQLLADGDGERGEGRHQARPAQAGIEDQRRSDEVDGLVLELVGEVGQRFR